MILTCPSCGTQYVVKDGAIPPHGRQVRCASCKHSWHQDPEAGEAAVEEPAPRIEPAAIEEQAPDQQEPPEETIAEAALLDPSSGPEAEERAFEEAALAAGAAPIDPVDAPAGYAPIAPPQPGQDYAAGPEEPRQEWAHAEHAVDDDFSPFVVVEHEPARRSPLLVMLLAALLIAAAAAAFWFLAPAEWKQRIGIAGAGETPLQLMMTHSDRQKLASGNELLAVSGRVINPTDEQQAVPPIQAQLRSNSGKLVYSWTIAPPARTLPPGASATFNSAEVNVPAGGDELTITLGSTKT